MVTLNGYFYSKERAIMTYLIDTTNLISCIFLVQEVYNLDINLRFINQIIKFNSCKINKMYLNQLV